MEWYYWLAVCLLVALAYLGFGKGVAEFVRDRILEKSLSRQSAWIFVLGWPLLLALAVICSCLLFLLMGFIIAVAIALVVIILGLFLFALVVIVAFLILAFGLSLAIIIALMIVSLLEGPVAIENIITKFNPLSPWKLPEEVKKKK